MSQRRKNSTYSSTAFGESERLRVQAEESLCFDQESLEAAYEQLGRDGLCVLDYGCAQGYVAQSRFGNDDRISKVICVDINLDSIEFAKQAQSDASGGLSEKLHFYHIENGDNPAEEIAQIMKIEGIEAFDLEMLVLVLHHVKRPVAILRNLRDFLCPGGFVFARSPEDGCMMAYPDGDNLVAEICRRHAAAQGASDRHHGRKLYDQFKKAGLKDVHVTQHCDETSRKAYEQRRKIFTVFFGYRLYPFERALESNPNDKKAQEAYEWMSDALEELEDQFMEESFWFCAYRYTALGRKPIK